MVVGAGKCAARCAARFGLHLRYEFKVKLIKYLKFIINVE